MKDELGREKAVRRASDTTSGHAVVETTLMLPWILLLFVLVFDFGFYAVALISVENAVRVSAHHASMASPTDSDMACQYVLNELRWLPNIGQGTTSCTASDPVQVTTALGTSCPESVASVDPNDPLVPACGEVSVTYETPQLFPLPWLMGQMTVRRVAEMRVRGN